MKKTAYIIAMGMLFWVVSAPLCADTPAGEFTYVEGRVDVLHSDTSYALQVVRGEGLNPGDTVRTKSFSRAEITFNDGSILRLAPDTRALVEQYDCDGQKRENA